MIFQEQYKAITTRIEVEDNSTTEIVNIRYSSNCNKKNSKRRKKCKNIPLGTAVEFTADITLKKCERQTGKQDQLIDRCNKIGSQLLTKPNLFQLLFLLLVWKIHWFLILNLFVIVNVDLKVVAVMIIQVNIVNFMVNVWKYF